MLYLVRGFDEDEKGELIPLLKIGYTRENNGQRESFYISAGIMMGFKKTREGNKTLESALHVYFNQYKYPKLNEWFYYNEEIIEKFDILSEEDIYKEVLEKLNQNKESYSWLIYQITHRTEMKKPKKSDPKPKLKELKETEKSKELKTKLDFSLDEIEEETTAKDFYRKIRRIDFEKKMEALCLYLDKNSEYFIILKDILVKKDKILLDYWRYFGTEGCRKRFFKEFYLQEEYSMYLEKYNRAVLLDSLIDREKYYSITEIKELIIKNRKKLNIIYGKKLSLDDLTPYIKFSSKYGKHKLEPRYPENTLNP